MDPKEKFRLFKQTKHFCSAPWGLLQVKEAGEIDICVKSSIKHIGNIQHDNIDDILNNPERLSLKQDLLNDVETVSCKKCNQLENQGDGTNQYGHIRSEYNKLLKTVDIDYNNINEFVLGALDLHWSSVCDLKCITCWAKQSSSIAVEQNKQPRHTPSKNALELIDWIDKNQSTLQEVYLSGGEPTLIKYNLNLLQRLEKRNTLQIRVNSNMMWGQDNAILREILKFPNIVFTCSFDDRFDRFEYIRRGASWKKCIDNIKFLQSFSNVDIRINSVFSVLTGITIVDTIDYFSDMGIDNFTINQCSMDHTYLRCRNLPKLVKEISQKNIIAAKNKYFSNLNLVGQFNNCLAELDEKNSEDYKFYLDGIDKIANTNWKKLFKELQ